MRVLINISNMRELLQLVLLVSIICVLQLIVVTTDSVSQTTNIVWSEDWEGDWTRDWSVDGGTWEVGEPMSGPDTAFAGLRSAATVLGGNYSENVDARLWRHTSFVVPSASENPRLRFWHWFSISNDDAAYVQIKVGDGAWETISPSYNWTSSGVWTRPSIDLSQYAGQSVQIGFFFHSRPDGFGRTFVSSGWYIDDVTVVTGPIVRNNPEDWESGSLGDWSVDRGTWQIGIPTTGPNSAHSGENVAATVLDGNYHENVDSRLICSSFVVPSAGDNPRLRFWHWFSISNDDAAYVQIKVGDGAWETISPSYNWTSSGVWTRPSIDLSQYAGQSVQIGFFFHSRPDGFGRTFVSSGWYIDDVTVVTGPIVRNNPEDWESGSLGDWSVDRGTWQIGIPTTGPNSAHSGENVAATVLDGNYHENVDSRLICPSFVVPNASANLRLRFWHWFSISNDDAAYVQIKVEDGAWETILGPYTGTSSGVWTPPSKDLTPYAGQSVQIGFFFQSRPDGFGRTFVSSGWYVDDIQIDGLPTANMNIVVTPRSLNFEDILVGVTATKAVNVNNIGADSINVNPITIAGTNTDKFDVTPASLTLAPGMSRDLQVTFGADEPGHFTAFLNINSDSGSVTVPLAANAVDISISVTPEFVDFHEVVVGDTASQTIVVTNTGSTDLNVGPLIINGDDADNFAVDKTSFTLTPGATEDLAVDFTPDARRSFQASLETTSSGGNVSVPLSGIGKNPITCPAPSIASIIDVPNDQGKQVTVVWNQACPDTAGSEMPILLYGVWRRADELQTSSLPAKLEGVTVVDDFEEMMRSINHAAPGATYAVNSSSGVEDIWTFVGAVPAVQFKQYAFVSPTLYDSTKTSGIVWSVFFVSAHTDNPQVWFASIPDSGYSVDNLAPSVPRGVLANVAENSVELHWRPNPEEDFKHYSIYRDVAPNFQLREALAFSVDTVFADNSVDLQQKYYYKITASDFSGNESKPSNEVDIVVTAINDNSVTPKEFALHQNYPNPFNPETTIRYQLPKAGLVELTIYNALGEKVRNLVNEHKPQGEYQVQWNGKDDTGREVASGLYFYRFQVGEFVQTRKMLFLR